MQKQKFIIEIKDGIHPHLGLRAAEKLIGQGLQENVSGKNFYRRLMFFTDDISVKCEPVRDSTAVKLFVFLDRNQFGERHLL